MKTHHCLLIAFVSIQYLYTVDSFRIELITLIASILISPIYCFVFYIFNWMLGHIGLSIIDFKELVKNCYDTADTYIGKDHTSTGLDYGYNLYDGNRDLSAKQAQLIKYEYMWNSLRLKDGSKLLDIGCGYGDWMMYCKNKGVFCTGINISKKQSMSAIKRGLNVINKDWEESQLNTKFDAITCMDTIEHYVSPFDKLFLSKSDEKYEKLMGFIKHNLSTDGMFLTSCLFLQKPYKNWNMYLWLSAFVIDYSMGGYYPRLNTCVGGDMGVDQLTVAAKKHKLRLDNFIDTTENYRISQVWNQDCWQNSDNLRKKDIVWLVRNIIYTYFDSPSFFMSLLGYYNIGWTSFWGEDPLCQEYNSEYRQSISYIRCFIAIYSSNDV